MPLRTTVTRLGIAAAGSALAVLAATTPATADDDGNDNGNQHAWNDNGDQHDWNHNGNQQAWNHNDDQHDSNHNGNQQAWNHNDDQHDSNHNGDDRSDFFKGRVTARGGLVLRTAPNRGAAVIRVAPFGEIVKIFCKTPGETVDSNPFWYLLSDGTWAWGAARYIDNIGPAPRWC